MSIFGGFVVPFGGRFGLLFVTFSDFPVSKWEIELQTAF